MFTTQEIKTFQHHDWKSLLAGQLKHYLGKNLFSIAHVQTKPDRPGLASAERVLEFGAPFKLSYNEVLESIKLKVLHKLAEAGSNQANLKRKSLSSWIQFKDIHSDSPQKVC